MDTRKLSAFIETVRVGSINAAAEQLGYTQSGLSYILRSLEEELNVQLLERTPSGIALTENGKALFKDINAIVEKTDELNNKIIGLFSRQQHDKETIRLAAYPSTTVNWIAEEMASFMLKYPEFMIDMRVGVVAIPQWVENGMVDMELWSKAWFRALRSTTNGLICATRNSARFFRNHVRWPSTIA